MYRKVLTALVSACALAAVLVGPATASASTLTLYGPLIPDPATDAYFESDSTTVTFGSFPAQCGKFSIYTDITQNSADPVTLQLNSTSWAGPPSLVGCPHGSYSNIQLTAAMQFNANGTGTLPLSVTETWPGGSSCVRQGTLNLTYTPNTGYAQGSPVAFDGFLNKVSGSCPTSARFQGTFGGQGSSNGPTDEFGFPIDFVVTP
jgi:hypothetical protein